MEQISRYVVHNASTVKQMVVAANLVNGEKALGPDKEKAASEARRVTKERHLASASGNLSEAQMEAEMAAAVKEATDTVELEARITVVDDAIETLSRDAMTASALLVVHTTVMRRRSILKPGLSREEQIAILTAPILGQDMLA